MSARRIGYTVGVGVLAVSGLYILVYLYRWEWIRAQFAAVLFLCIEVALIGAWLAEKVAALQNQQNAQSSPGSGARSGRGPFREVDPEVLARLRSAREAESSHPFAWLTPRMDRTSVFVPVLLGAGVLLSGLAWLVERIAARTAGPSSTASSPPRSAPLRCRRRCSPLRPRTTGFCGQVAFPAVPVAPAPRRRHTRRPSGGSPAPGEQPDRCREHRRSSGSALGTS